MLPLPLEVGDLEMLLLPLGVGDLPPTKGAWNLLRMLATGRASHKMVAGVLLTIGLLPLQL